VARWPSALALLLAALPALADWTRLGEGNAVYQAYADRDTIQKAGEHVRMNGLYDIRMNDVTPDGRPYRSTVTAREYDCRGRQVRILSFADYSGPMASGEIVSVRERTGRWEPVLAGGIDEKFLEVACAGR
jgi:hypothetical protein